MIHRHATLASTNDEALRLAAAGAPHGEIVVAGQQSGGRGRHGRHWISPPGNLHASILLRPRDGARLTELAFVAALAVADAVDAITGGANARLKWPNDVLAGEAKVAGILIEAEGGAAVIGVGINLAHAPAGLAYPTAAIGGGVDDALIALTGALGRRFAAWQADGFAATLARWRERGPAPGQPMVVNGVLTGNFAGLDGDGALLLRVGGEVRRIVTGDVLER